MYLDILKPLKLIHFKDENTHHYQKRHSKKF